MGQVEDRAESAWRRLPSEERGQGQCCGGMLPSHMRVQVPQGLCGVRGGVHAGNRFAEGVASCFLRLDATSSPAFSVQPLGDVLEVPKTVPVRMSLTTAHLFLRPVPPFTANDLGPRTSSVPSPLSMSLLCLSSLSLCPPRTLSLRKPVPIPGAKLFCLTPKLRQVWGAKDGICGLPTCGPARTQGGTLLHRSPLGL